MSLSSQTIRGLAAHLDRAVRDVRAIHKLTDDHPGMTVEDGYAVQDALRAIALARGERLAGYKAGLTSAAKMKQMGVSVPAFGYLTDAMRRADGSEIEVASLVHPRIEPEVAFVTKRALAGRCDVAEVIAATEAVVPAIEVIDSRFENFRFDLPSVIADDTSASRFVTGGPPGDPRTLPLDALEVVMEKNGVVVTRGSSAAVLGHPALAIVALVEHLAARGEELPAGSVVMTGGITEAVAVAAGDRVSARVEGLGAVSFRFV